jgi:RNA polymerase-binding protein DksA
MNIKFLSQFKNWLEKTRKDIQNKIKRLYKVPDFGSDVDSGEEESDESEEFSTQLSIAQTYKERLADIDTALGKIEKKKYGICEKCGKKISLDVLKITPESRLCKQCKKKFR